MITNCFFFAKTQSHTQCEPPLRLCAFAVIFFVLLTSCSDDSKPSQTAKPDPVQFADPCTVIPNKIMDPNASDSVMSSDFGYLLSCGQLDSFDLQHVVPNLIPEVLADQVQSGHDSITYRLIIEKVKEFHGTPAYAQIKSRFRVLDSLRASVIDPKNWQRDTFLLAGLGMEKTTFPHLERIVKELQKKNKNVTWAHALDSTDDFLRHSPTR